MSDSLVVQILPALGGFLIALAACLRVLKIRGNSTCVAKCREWKFNATFGFGCMDSVMNLGSRVFGLSRNNNIPEGDVQSNVDDIVELADALTVIGEQLVQTDDKHNQDTQTK